MSLDAHLDTVWAGSADPWGYRERWYEARKRALLMASLDRPRYAKAWETGCANGVLTRALAGRCGALLATDLHPRAVREARRHCGDLAHVEIAQMEHPRQWPPGRFDLVVVGEIGYYLAPDGLREFARRLRGSLAPGALLVACHWREDFDGRRSSTDEVHACLGALPGMARVFMHDEADFLLEGWSNDPHTPAQREGLR